MRENGLTPLPIDVLLPQIVSALRTSPNIVIGAARGGKDDACSAGPS